MPKVDPTRLRELRELDGLTQEELSRKSNVDKQTISRLERGENANPRAHTVKSICAVLGIDPEVLAGDAPVPDAFQDRKLKQFLHRKSPLRLEISNSCFNALILVAKRYHTTAAYIVELAPLLFLAAAEDSLRSRKARLSELYEIWKAMADKAPHFTHLAPAATGFVGVQENVQTEDSLNEEQSSIESNDIFARKIDPEYQNDPRDGYGDLVENPFAAHLKSMIDELGELADVTDPEDFSYRLCPAEAATIVDGDEICANGIMDGTISLAELPKELGPGDKVKERTEWIRSRLDQISDEAKELFPELFDMLNSIRRSDDEQD